MKYFLLLGSIIFIIASFYYKEFLGVSGWMTAAGLFFIDNFSD